jgi:hypothetical protein
MLWDNVDFTKDFLREIEKEYHRVLVFFFFSNTVFSLKYCLRAGIFLKIICKIFTSFPYILYTPIKPVEKINIFSSHILVMAEEIVE